MGLRAAFRRLWRVLHPRYQAMSPSEISAMDRAVSESMAKGSFGPRRRPAEPAAAVVPTGDQLWSSSSSAAAAAAPADHLLSLSSHRSAGRASVSSSRGHDSGYGEQPPGHAHAHRPASRPRQAHHPHPQQAYYHHHHHHHHHQDPHYWHPQHEHDEAHEGWSPQDPRPGPACRRQQPGGGPPTDGHPPPGPYVPPPPAEAACDAAPGPPVNVHG